MFNQNFMDALNLLNLYSIWLGLENLYENRQQSEQNDVNAANEREAKYILEQLGKKFDEQNGKLDRILEILERQELET